MEVINAAKKGDADLVKEFLAARFHNTAHRDESGNSAMHWAAFGAHPEALGVLLHAGANVCIVNSNGETPLHYAVIGSTVTTSSGSAGDGTSEASIRKVEEVVKLLLNAGVDAAARDGAGRTAQEHAAALVQQGEQQLPGHSRAAAILKLLKEDALNLTSAAKHLQMHMMVDLHNHLVALQRELPVVRWAGATLQAKEAVKSSSVDTIVDSSSKNSGSSSAAPSSWFSAKDANRAAVAGAASGPVKLPCGITAAFLSARAVGGAQLLSNAERDFNVVEGNPALSACYTRFIRTMSSAIAANHSLVMGLLNDPRGRSGSSAPAPPEQVLDFVTGLAQTVHAAARAGAGGYDNEAAQEALGCLAGLYSARCHNNAQCVRAVKRLAARFPSIHSHCFIEIVGRSLCVHLQQTGVLAFKGSTGTVDSAISDGCARLPWAKPEELRRQSLVLTSSGASSTKVGPQQQVGAVTGQLLAYSLLEYLVLTDPAVEVQYADAALLMQWALHVLEADSAADTASVVVYKVDGVEMSIVAGESEQKPPESVNDVKNWIKKTAKVKQRASVTGTATGSGGAKDAAVADRHAAMHTRPPSGSIDLQVDPNLATGNGSQRRNVSDTAAALQSIPSIHMARSSSGGMEDILNSSMTSTGSTNIEQNVEDVVHRLESHDPAGAGGVAKDTRLEKRELSNAASLVPEEDSSRGGPELMIEVSDKSGNVTPKKDTSVKNTSDIPLDLQSPAPYRNTTAVTVSVPPSEMVVPLQLQSPAPYRGTENSPVIPFAETPPPQQKQQKQQQIDTAAPAAGGCCVIS